MLLFGLEVPLAMAGKAVFTKIAAGHLAGTVLGSHAGAAALNFFPHGAAVASQAVGAMPSWFAVPAHTAAVSAAHAGASSAALLPHAASAGTSAVTQLLNVLEVTGLVGVADFALQSGRTLSQAGHEFRNGDTEEGKRLLKRAWTEARPLGSFVDFTDWAIKVLDVQELPTKAQAMARKELMRLEVAHA